MESVNKVVLQWLDGNVTADEAMQEILCLTVEKAVGVIVDVEAVEVVS